MTNGNDFAHPTILEEEFSNYGGANGKRNVYYSGLTKREYFAAMAMQGILSNHLMIDNDINGSFEWVAKASVNLSDALINELNKTP